MNGWDLFTYLMVGTLFISAILIFIAFLGDLRDLLKGGS